MDKEAKIYVAGHTGMVGTAIINVLKSKGYNNILTKCHKELDLMNQKDVELFFMNERPTHVFLIAAKVGGINANIMFPAEFLYNNIMIQANVIQMAYKYNISKLIFIGSVSMYPKEIPQPIKEEYLLTGVQEKTDEGYALAKIVGVRMCEYYNKQYGTDFYSLIPCNLYGENDNYTQNDSKLVASLIRRFHEAKMKGLKEVSIWGDGYARREFMHANDLADAAVFLMNHNTKYDSLNVGYGEDYTIREFAEIVSKVVKYEGKITFDTNMPSGIQKKLLDSSKFYSLGWKPKISLIEGLEMVYEDYLKNYQLYRH